MAKAEKKVETRSVVTGVTLDLSEEEAYFILHATRSVGGPRQDSARQVSDSILDALRAAGLSANDPQYERFSESMTGYLSARSW